jgi:CRISPR-associated exonuclease Cas4
MLSIGLGLFFLVLAILILKRNERLYRRRNVVMDRHRMPDLPKGTLIYEDVDGQGALLSSRQYPLVGKPDYVIKQADGRLVPIELKPLTRNAATPYSNHVVQLAAYCLILEDYADRPPTHGILRYADREFTIDYTPRLRKKVLRLLDEMALANKHHAPPLEKQQATKCRVCAFQTICAVGQSRQRSQ